MNPPDTKLQTTSPSNTAPLPFTLGLKVAAAPVACAA